MEEEIKKHFPGISKISKDISEFTKDWKMSERKDESHKEEEKEE